MATRQKHARTLDRTFERTIFSLATTPKHNFELGSICRTLTMFGQASASIKIVSALWTATKDLRGGLRADGRVLLLVFSNTPIGDRAAGKL